MATAHSTRAYVVTQGIQVVNAFTVTINLISDITHTSHFTRTHEAKTTP